MNQIAICYGKNAVPAQHGTTPAPHARAVAGARLAIGSGVNLPTESSVKPTACSGTTKDGSSCGARPAKGTELCIGHLRSEGRS